MIERRVECPGKPFCSRCLAHVPDCRCLPLLQIAWIGLSSLAFNRWITREELVERGFEKLVNEYDGKLASEQKVSRHEGVSRGADMRGSLEVPACCWVGHEIDKIAPSHAFALCVMPSLHPMTCIWLQVGEATRPLTMASIEDFLRDFGLDPEFATHSNIRGLSGGQKVRDVTLAPASSPSRESPSPRLLP